MRQPEFLFLQNAGSNFLMLIIHLITVGKKDELFAVEWCIFDRGNNFVGNQIVNEISTGGARITQIVDLNGSRATG